MTHGSGQHLPGWLSESLSVIGFLQPQSQDLSQTVFTVAFVSLYCIKFVSIESESQPNASPSGSYWFQRNVDIKQVISTCIVTKIISQDKACLQLLTEFCSWRSLLLSHITCNLWFWRKITNIDGNIIGLQQYIVVYFPYTRFCLHTLLIHAHPLK